MKTKIICLAVLLSSVTAFSQIVERRDMSKIISYLNEKYGNAIMPRNDIVVSPGLPMPGYQSCVQSMINHSLAVLDKGRPLGHLMDDSVLHTGRCRWINQVNDMFDKSKAPVTKSNLLSIIEKSNSSYEFRKNIAESMKNEGATLSSDFTLLLFGVGSPFSPYIKYNATAESGGCYGNIQIVLRSDLIPDTVNVGTDELIMEIEITGNCNCTGPGTGTKFDGYSVVMKVPLKIMRFEGEWTDHKLTRKWAKPSYRYVLSDFMAKYKTNLKVGGKCCSGGISDDDEKFADVKVPRKKDFLAGGGFSVSTARSKTAPARDLGLRAGALYMISHSYGMGLVAGGGNGKFGSKGNEGVNNFVGASIVAYAQLINISSSAVAGLWGEGGLQRGNTSNAVNGALTRTTTWNQTQFSLSPSIGFGFGNGWFLQVTQPFLTSASRNTHVISSNSNSTGTTTNIGINSGPATFSIYRSF